VPCYASATLVYTLGYYSGSKAGCMCYGALFLLGEALAKT